MLQGESSVSEGKVSVHLRHQSLARIPPRCLQFPHNPITRPQTESVRGSVPRSPEGA
jgi:hypothetical protein